MICCTQHVMAQFILILPNRLSCSGKYFTFESLSIIYETENVPKKTEYIPDIIWECSWCYDRGIHLHPYIYFVSQHILWYLLLQRWYWHYQFLLQNIDHLISTRFILTELSSLLKYRICHLKSPNITSKDVSIKSSFLYSLVSCKMINNK